MNLLSPNPPDAEEDDSPQDRFLIELMDRETALLADAKRFGLEDGRAQSLYEHSIHDLILDFIGVPPDDSCFKSQNELSDGKCQHGVEFFCRDWLLGWFMGDEEAREEFPTSEVMLPELHKLASEWPESRYRCPKCEAGDHDFDREMREMVAMNSVELDALTEPLAPQRIS